MWANLLLSGILRYSENLHGTLGCASFQRANCSAFFASNLKWIFPFCTVIGYSREQTFCLKVTWQGQKAIKYWFGSKENQSMNEGEWHARKHVNIMKDFLSNFSFFCFLQKRWALHSFMEPQIYGPIHWLMEQRPSNSFNCISKLCYIIQPCNSSCP